MSTGEVTIPPALLAAVATRGGRVSLVLGAGCSLEAPTSLKLSSAYAEAAHEELLADGMLERSECVDPSDLSVLASAVFSRHGSQAGVVTRLPRSDLRYARANEGYLLAAALVCEGAVNLVATLNYDLALTDAVRQLDGREIEEIAGPAHLQFLGTRAIIYLHRNVNEADCEKWILRKEALAEEWRDSWESVVVARIAASPVVVFAGLGSPAAVLTETIAWVRRAVPDVLQAYLVDPASASTFAEALELPDANYVRATWGQFMVRLADRVADGARRDLVLACQGLCRSNGWTDDPHPVSTVCAALQAAGLLMMGHQRAAWLTSERRYLPDSAEGRPLIADLVLAIALMTSLTGRSPHFEGEGVVHLVRDDSTIRVLPVSGGGHRRWSQLDGLVANRPGSATRDLDVILASGFADNQPEHVVPPPSIVDDDSGDDITQGRLSPLVVSTDELRADPESILEHGFR